MKICILTRYNHYWHVFVMCEHSLIVPYMLNSCVDIIGLDKKKA